MNRPDYQEARRRITHLEAGTNAPPTADAVLVLARAVLAIAEAINKSHQEKK